MISRSFVHFLIILTLSGCSKNGSTAPTDSQSSDKISNLEYALLQMLVDSCYHYSSDSVLVLRDSTTSGTHGYNLDSTLTNTLQYVKQHIAVLDTEAMQDFKLKNLTCTFIHTPTSVHPACVLSSKTDKTYPWMEVSRVGFSSDGRQALAYVGRMDAPLGGSGSYHVLSQENGKWVIIGSVMIWIS